MEKSGHERRIYRRIPRRLSVRYGEGGLDRASFTRNVSVGGLHIIGESGTQGRRLHLQVFLEGGGYALVEGVVCWEKRVPANLKAVVPGGFGVRFLSMADLLAETLASVAPGEPDDDEDGADEVLAAAAAASQAPVARALPSTARPAAPAPSAALIAPAQPVAAPAPVARPSAQRLGQVATGRAESPFVFEARTREEATRLIADVRNGRMAAQSALTLPPGGEAHVELRVAYAGSVGSVRAVGKVMAPEPGLRVRTLKIQLADPAGTAAAFAALVR